MKIEKILAGIDLGPDTEKVLSYASLFAKSSGASLKLLYVIDYLVTPPAYLTSYIEEEKKSAEEEFVPWDKRLKDYGVNSEFEVMVGRLNESFEAEVKKAGVDMLILGYRPHVLRRSSSEKLIRGLNMPMLAVRGEKAESSRIGSLKIEKLLCPVDFSEVSMKALGAAKELNAIFSSKLDVIHVIPSHIIKGKMTEGKDKDKAIRELFQNAKDALGKFLSDSGVGKEGVIDEGEPYEKIISFSTANDIDLIVIGAHGLSLTKGTLIGSVADAVLRSSPCPVLVMH